VESAINLASINAGLQVDMTLRGRGFQGGEQAFNSIEGNPDLTPQEKLLAHKEMITRLEAVKQPGLGHDIRSVGAAESYMKAAVKEYGQDALDMQKEVQTSVKQQVTVNEGQNIGTGRVTRGTDEKTGNGRLDKAVSTAISSIDKPELSVSLKIPGKPEHPVEKQDAAHAMKNAGPREQGQRIFNELEKRTDLTAGEKQLAYQEITAQIMRNGRVGDKEVSGPEKEREQGFLQAFANKHGEKALVAIESAKNALPVVQSVQQSVEQSQTVSDVTDLQQKQGVSQPQTISQGDGQKETLQETQKEVETPPLGNVTDIQTEQGISPPQVISQDDDQQQSLQETLKEEETPSLGEVTDIQEEQSVSHPQEISQDDDQQESLQQTQKQKEIPSVGVGKDTGIGTKQDDSDPGKLAQKEDQQQKRSVRDSLGSQAWKGASAPKNGQQRSVRDALGAHRGEPKPEVKTQAKIGGHRSM
jgi:hypothetical protein